MTQLFALVRLSNRRLATLKGVRVARLYALNMGFGYVLFTLFLHGASVRRLGQIVQESLSFASWLVCGIAAFAVLRAPRGFDTSWAELGRLRGYTSAHLQKAYWLSLGLRLALDLVIAVFPALLVIALLADAPTLGQRVGWPLLGGLYAASLGLAIAGLVVLAQRATRDHAVSLFLSLMIAPELLAIFTTLPGFGLPGLFSRALDWMFVIAPLRLGVG
ncbi:MAG TPA: hypothetical protein VFQ61_00320 [Polyangiaceae bacterium]|nr:hypothetical protein [Polyangiaceae bacterium]